MTADFLEHGMPRRSQATRDAARRTRVYIAEMRAQDVRAGDVIWMSAGAGWVKVDRVEQDSDRYDQVRLLQEGHAAPWRSPYEVIKVQFTDDFWPYPHMVDAELPFDGSRPGEQAMRDCPACDGGGCADGGEQCPVCEGDGVVE